MSVPPLRGILNVDKPGGLTSRQVVNRIGSLVGKTKIGHAGTLDPLATGVLIVCVGAATRLFDRIQDLRKGYRAELKLGVRSDTDDITGTLSAGGDPSGITADDIRRILSQFQGETTQVAPRYSAVHIGGRRAYDLARSGQEFDLSTRIVQIDSAMLTAYSQDFAEIEIVCGSGTYVRSLIRDLGERLGCGAVMTALRRTFIGPFQESDASPLDELTAETLLSRLMPLRALLSDDPKHAATQAECDALRQGRGIVVSGDFSSDKLRIAVLDPSGELVAFADWDPLRHLLQPRQVFAD